MKKHLFAMAAVAALAAAASSANAATVSISTAAGDVISKTLITDFDSNSSGLIIAPGYSFDQGTNGLAYTRDGSLGLDPNFSAPPPGDTGFYETVEGNGGKATLTSTKGLSSFQFYMGSPDSFNGMTFTFIDTNNQAIVLSGTQIWGGHPAGDGNQSEGFTVSYYFSAPVKTIEFTSGNQNAFEFDKLAGGVPEPASWALMIGGFGLAGASIRAKRRQAATA